MEESARVALARFRAQFPALERMVYLNTAVHPPGAAPVVAAVRAAEDEWIAGDGRWRRWEAIADATRGQFGSLIGVAPDHVALVSSLAQAAATVATSVEPGRVVVGASEFRSSLFPFLALAERGCELEVVEPRAGAQRVEDLAERVAPGTTLVAVSSVQSATGYRGDLTDLVRRTHDVGGRVFVNLTQGAGVVPCPIADLEIDYAAAHGYKWLLAPRGAGWLYVRPDHIEAMRPLEPSWKSVADPYDELYGPPYEPAPRASRLDCSLAWFSWVGAEAALRLLAGLDATIVEQWCTGLAGELRDHLISMGHRPAPTDLPSHIVAFDVEDPALVEERLRRRGIAAAVRGGRVRVGFHAFNDADDLDALCEALSGPR